MTKRNTPTLISGHPHPFHTAPSAFKSGQEITFDGGTWGMVEEVVGKTIWVTDEDGGDHELTDSRID